MTPEDDMRLVERFYPEAQYGGFSDIDGTVAFYSRVQALLQPGMTVLDVGCGRGAEHIDDPIPFRRGLRNLRNDGRTVIGIDVDPDAATNPAIDQFHLIGADLTWPVADGIVDLIVSDFVLEHVDVPQGYFSEVARVLKPGGFFCARTSNRMGYVALSARLVPNRLHARVLSVAQQGRAEVDIFPTRFRVNTQRQAKRALKQAGLAGIAYGYDAEPSYLEFSAPLYAVGKYLHAATPKSLRNSLFIFARKPHRM